MICMFLYLSLILGTPLHTYAEGEARVDFAVHQPRHLSADHTYPLLVIVHGYGMTPRWMARIVRPSWFPDMFVVIPRAPYPFTDDRHEGIVYQWWEGRGTKRSLAHAASVVRLSIRATRELHPQAAGPVILLGYSQGGAVALAFGALHGREVDTIVTAGGWQHHCIRDLGPPEKTRGKFVVFVHGTRDRRIRPWAVRHTLSQLRQAGARVKDWLFEGEHRPTPRVFREVSTWINRHAQRLAAQNTVRDSGQY